jgi:uncharacterized protein
MLTEKLKLERLTVTIGDLPADLVGTKIIQLSDLHHDGSARSAAVITEAIDISNAQNPDLVVLTGDFINHSPQPIYELAKQLGLLRSRVGTYAILGNHDLLHRSSKAEIIDALAKVGIPTLWNQVVYPLGAGIALVGLAEYWSRDWMPAGVMAPIGPTIPRLVLAHNPDCAAELRPWRVDLQLSGHTHGGQIELPVIGNLSALAVRNYDLIPSPLKVLFPCLKVFKRVLKNWQWVRGLHNVGGDVGGNVGGNAVGNVGGGNRLYVNRGLGTYWPGRLFCPPEVTLIELR